ncbi:MAG: iron ABC transporter substrate-binding protein [Solirubrobacterales bacterium]
MASRSSGTRRAAALIAGAATTLTLAIGATACGSDKSGPITIYSGREEELMAPLFELYEEETGNEVEVRYGDSAELAATILEEGDKTPADVFFSQDAGALGALEKEGRLSELGESIISSVDERYRSRDGLWVGTSGRARVIAYDSRELSRSDLPDSVLDLTGPKWDGRVGWAPTNGSFQAFVTALRLTEGDDAAREWLEGMDGNGTESFADNSSIRDAIAAGEIDLGLINHYYVAQAQEEEGAGYPVEVHFPTGGDVGALINVAGAGVLAGSERQEESSEFVAFLLSPQAQRFFAEETKEYPLIDGVEADPSVVPLSRIEQPRIDLSNLDDLQGTLIVIEESGAL